MIRRVLVGLLIAVIYVAVVFVIFSNAGQGFAPAR